MINDEALPHEYVTTQTAWQRNAQLRCQLDEGMWNKLKERNGTTATILKKEHKFRVCGCNMLKKIFGSKPEKVT